MSDPLRDDIPPVRIAQTQIKDNVRVSSCAFYKQVSYGFYWLFETWIFSTDPSTRNQQIIHGTISFAEPDEINGSKLLHKTKKAHEHIASNLRKKKEVTP